MAIGVAANGMVISQAPTSGKTKKRKGPDLLGLDVFLDELDGRLRNHAFLASGSPSGLHLELERQAVLGAELVLGAGDGHIDPVLEFLARRA